MFCICQVLEFSGVKLENFSLSRKLKSETKLSESNVAFEIMVKDWGGNMN
jgi:hypothetical protein